ncbi:MAG: hypothetical protein KC443_10585 [Anaerolineales bacterium]|nr:hypothetical protein [Anaerolineales bacterium]
MNSSDFGVNPSFAVEVSGQLSGGIEVSSGLIGTVVQAIVQITAEPVKKVIIHLVEFRAEIQIISDRADRVVRVAKFRNIAEVYNKALLQADGIWYFTDELKEEYINMLRQDYTQQFKRLLHSD